MKHKIFFLISPRPELAQRLARYRSESLLDLTESTLWSSEESDRSILQRSDTDALVKLLFVDLVKREHLGSPALQEVFGTILLTTDFFDAHWSISRIPLDMTVEDALEDSLQSGSVNSMLPSGSSRLDEVLVEYQVRAARDG